MGINSWLLAVVLAAPAMDADRDCDRFTKVAGRLMEAFNKLDPEAIRNEFDDSMLRDFSPEKTRELLLGLTRQYGKIQRLGNPKLVPTEGAIIRAECGRGKLDIKLFLNERDRVTGMHFERAIPVPSRNQVSLALPFTGRWLVSWGGDTADVNQHHHCRPQCFAFDFACIGAGGRTFVGLGLRNEDYYAFGRELLAPANGTVTEVIEGVRDNLPGSRNTHCALGNAVFIQHGPYEFSVLAHLQQGSIRVKAGDKVKKGQVLGLCGNSGNSSEPHLHFHLENSPLIQDATGIKCYFEKVVLLASDGKSEARPAYSPTKGDVISRE